MRDCSLGLEGMDLCKGDMSRIELCCKRELRKLQKFAKKWLTRRCQRDPTRTANVMKITRITRTAKICKISEGPSENYENYENCINLQRYQEWLRDVRGMH